MSTPFLHARQTRYAVYVTTYVVVVVAVIVAANVLANRYDRSYDTTANKRYSLSDQTAKIIKELKQPVYITYYDQTPRFDAAKDTLDQYARLSPMVHVDYVDPDKKPEAAREANVTAYGTTLVKIGARTEQAKGVTEEDITGAVIRDLKSNTRTVCFAEGSGEHQIEDTERNGYSQFKDLLSKDEYEAKSINLIQTAAVPDDCTVLVLAGPTANYLQPEVDAIQKYVEGGGRAMILLDPPLKLGHTEIADNDALNKTLETWGVTPDKNLIIDLNPIGQLAGVGPEVALVSAYDSQPIVSDLTRRVTGFPLARAIESKNAEKVTIQPLFSSSDTSLATTKLNSAAINPNDPSNAKGPFQMAVAGTYDTGKQNSQGRFVVVGSSSWPANAFISFNSNPDLALNAVNWLASDEDLISIRPKNPEDRRITLTNGQLNLVRLSSQFLLPLIIVAGGVSVWWRRR